MATGPALAREIDFRRRALDKACVAGTISLNELPRTRQAVMADAGAPVDVEIGFAEDAQRRVMLTGRARTRLILPCQRCLKSAEWAVDIAIGGMVVTSDEAAANVPRGWEPILTRGELLDVHSLVDDELLLALPMTVQCDRPACRASYDKMQVTMESSSSQDASNPFAALASLKRDDDGPH